MTMTPAELTAFLDRALPHLDLRRFTIEEVTPDEARVRLTVGERDQRPGGTLSGPSLMELADMASFVCVLAPIGPVALAVTASLTIHFLRKPRLEDVVARARALRRGKRFCVIEVEMWTVGEQAPIAHATVTFALPPEAEWP
jgi:uncharacterized protein (TIGR00369 family)